MTRTHVLTAWLLTTMTAPAAVTLPALFTDHCVLQRALPVPVWGWATPGEQITVAFAGQKKTTVVEATGRWQLTLDPMSANAQSQDLIVNDLTIKDVVVGEVWLCSGQSNMEMALRLSDNAAPAVAQADLPRIRLFRTPKHGAGRPQDDCAGKWEVCAPASAAAFSAVGYFFGRELHRALDVPVGLLQAAWGGTPAESWLSLAGLRAEPVLKPALTRRDRAAEVNPVAGSPMLPTALFNGMIAPLVPFRCRGVLWYHGGANSTGRNAFNYRRVLPALIRDWRQQWRAGDFPFYIVQLTKFGQPNDDPNQFGGRTLVREAQLQALAVTNTGLAVTIDLGEDGDKHPKQKRDVGRRLALLALARTYGQPVADSGPIYAGMTVEGAVIRLHFQHADGGLVARDRGELARFAIAGADRKFVWADAVIDKETVLVSSPAVPKPVAVRYAWSDNPAGANLTNQTGLPASPFRTDDW